MWIACVVLSSIVRVTIGASGEEPNGASTACQISSDGRLVLFTSSATNLVSSGPISVAAFLRDVEVETTECVTCEMDGAGTSAVAMSPNGRYVGYLDSLPNYWVVDRWTGVSHSVAFWGGDVASSVAAGTHQGVDLSVTDNRTGATVDSIPLPAIGMPYYTSLSRTGRFLGYQIGLYDPQAGGVIYSRYVLDRSTSTTELVDENERGPTGPMRISDDGRFVCYAGRTSTVLYDRMLAATRNYPAGRGIVMTPDARFIAWVGAEGRVHVLDRMTGMIQPGPYGRDLSLSDDGSRVAFTSDLPIDRHDTNGMSDVYLWMR